MNLTILDQAAKLCSSCSITGMGWYGAMCQLIDNISSGVKIQLK